MAFSKKVRNQQKKTFFFTRTYRVKREFHFNMYEIVAVQCMSQLGIALYGWVWMCMSVFLCSWRRRDSNQNMMKKSPFLLKQHKILNELNTQKKVVHIEKKNHSARIHWQRCIAHMHCMATQGNTRTMKHLFFSCILDPEKNNVRARWAFFSHSDLFVAQFFFFSLHISILFRISYLVVRCWSLALAALRFRLWCALLYCMTRAFVFVFGDESANNGSINGIQFRFFFGLLFVAFFSFRIWI